MNMTGHRLFTLAALALLAVACNREAISPDNGRDEVIDFSAYFAQDATKAVGEKTILVNKDTMGVFACYTGAVKYDLSSVSPDFMYNQDVTYDGSNWTYSPVKYWPNNSTEYISFFSYYPYISSEKASKAKDGIIGFSNADAKGDPWLVFRLPEKAPTEQTDLLYGTPHFDVEKNRVSEKVDFKLNHALACLADKVKVTMSQGLYNQVHDSLDISITGLSIVYSNLTTKARLVLNSVGEPNWKEVISGELLTSRSYRIPNITGKEFPMGASGPDSLVIDNGNGLFYIPLQIAGQPRPQAKITLCYSINGKDDTVSYADSVSTVVSFSPGDASYKQDLVLTLTENLCLDADIVTRPGGGVSMPGDISAVAKPVDVQIDSVTFEYPTSGSPAVQTYIIPRTGRYTLKAWGAQGGKSVQFGAKGRMAQADFEFSIGDVLYIYLGGKGEDATKVAGGSGGWNGGGTGGAPNGSYYGGGGGGGATHIAMSDIGVIGNVSPFISKLSPYMGTIGDLLLVAAGGGGGGWANNAGSGGQEQGECGGNQSPWNNSDYSYGKTGGVGGTGEGGAEGNGGGGAGFVGGNAKTSTNTDAAPSSGGSGGNSTANIDRYNYSGGFRTSSDAREGNGLSGQVIIKFKESL